MTVFFFSCLWVWWGLYTDGTERNASRSLTVLPRLFLFFCSGFAPLLSFFLFFFHIPRENSNNYKHVHPRVVETCPRFTCSTSLAGARKPPDAATKSSRRRRSEAGEEGEDQTRRADPIHVNGAFGPVIAVHRRTDFVTTDQHP